MNDKKKGNEFSKRKTRKGLARRVSRVLRSRKKGKKKDGLSGEASPVRDRSPRGGRSRASGRAVSNGARVKIRKVPKKLRELEDVLGLLASRYSREDNENENRLDLSGGGKMAAPKERVSSHGWERESELPGETSQVDVGPSEMGDLDLSGEEGVRGEVQHQEVFEEGGLGFSKTMTFLKFVIGFFVLLSVAVIGASVFVVLRYNGSPSGVTLDIELPEGVYQGAPFDLEVGIDNKSDKLLSEAVVTLILPRDVEVLETGAQGQTFSESFGDIGGGSLHERTFTLLPVLGSGSSGDSRKVIVRLAYSLGDSGFEMETVEEFGLKDPAIEIELGGDDQIINGSIFDLEVVYKNSSDFDFSNLSLEAEYPSAFDFVSADLPPDSLNNYWDLGALRSGSTGKLVIKGKVEGFQGTKVQIPITISGVFLGEDYPIESQVVRMVVAPSPIGLEILVNGGEDYVAQVGERINYKLRYKNNSGVALSDVTVKANLLGELFDFSTLSSDSSVDLLRGTLGWDSSNVPSLAFLEPGFSGEATFSIKLKDQFPITRFGDRNFYLKVDAEADSPTVPYYLSGERTRAITEKSVRVAGSVLVDAQVFYRDAASGIINNGPIPPRVGSSTQYTIHWVLRNYSTDLRGVKVNSFLPPGVRWVGVAKSDEGEAPKHNAYTGEVVWEVDKLLATKGVISAPAEAIFQVEAVPDLSLVGKFQALLGRTTLTATDDFTGVTIRATDLPLTSSLLDDLTVLPSEGIVAP